MNGLGAKKATVAFALVAAALTSCATPGISYQNMGAVLGAVAGGEMATQMGGKGRAPRMIGTILGTIVGASVGAKMDEVDRMQHQNAFNAAGRAPLNQPIRWENQQNGHYGTVTPIRQGHNTAGQTCREFETTVTIDGQVETAVGRACLTPGGVWQVQP